MNRTPILAVLLLAGCASAYGPRSLTGGYSEKWIAPTEVVVYATGNGFTSADATADMAAFRACELALAAGYQHFIVIEGGTTTGGPEVEIAPATTEVNPNGYGGATATHVPATRISTWNPRSGLRVSFLTDDQAEAARQRGASVIDAEFYVRANANERVRKLILGE